MVPYLVLGGLLSVLLVLELILVCTGRQLTLSTRTSCWSLASVFLLSTGYLGLERYVPFWFQRAFVRSNPDDFQAPNSFFPAGEVRTDPLSTGEAWPAIEAKGWVNGPPPELDRNRLTVVDVWADW